MFKFHSRVLLQGPSYLNIIFRCLIVFLESLSHQQPSDVTYKLLRKKSNVKQCQKIDFLEMFKFYRRVLLRVPSYLNIIFRCLMMFLESLSHQQHTDVTYKLLQKVAKKMFDIFWHHFQQCSNFTVEFYFEVLLI